MLDAEARTLLDLIDKAFQDGRPKPNTLPYTAGRTVFDKVLEDSEADPPEVAAVENGGLPDRLAGSVIGAIGRWAYQAGRCRP